MRSVFISDLHLDEQRPEITALFLEFLNAGALGADRMFILGDLFEAWIGDDHETTLADQVAGSLRTLADSGVPIAFIHGNRDFLLGPGYARRAGMQLLEDGHIIELAGRRALICHGDTFCTDDIEYQRFRQQVRTTEWCDNFLAKPLEERIQFAEYARSESQAQTRNKDDAIMDVNPDAIRSAFRHANVDLLIHGHTHRPALHELDIGGQPVQRLVLGDWYEQGSAAIHDSTDGLRLIQLPAG